MSGGGAHYERRADWGRAQESDELQALRRIAATSPLGRRFPAPDGIHETCRHSWGEHHDQYGCLHGWENLGRPDGCQCDAKPWCAGR
jgi:hypothetical protein